MSRGAGNQSRNAVSKGTGRLRALRESARSQSPAYLDIDSRLVIGAVASLASHGCAVRFGGATGGRGLSLAVYDGEDVERTVVLDADEFTVWAETIIEAYADGLAEDIRELLKLGK